MKIPAYEYNFCGCGNTKAKRAARCRSCWNRRFFRDPLPSPADETIRHIPLGKNLVVTISVEDFPKIGQFNWSPRWRPETKSYYAIRWQSVNGKSRYIYMHREIMNAPANRLVDHRDHDTLNNRRSNLRECTRDQNGQNRCVYANNISGSTGVSWRKRGGRWAAYINANGKRKYLGEFHTKQDAIAARQKAEDIYHGEFAYRQSIHNSHPADI